MDVLIDFGQRTRIVNNRTVGLRFQVFRLFVFDSFEASMGIYAVTTHTHTDNIYEYMSLFFIYFITLLFGSDNNFVVARFHFEY